ncbi:hypothetical protein, partial [Anaerococcus sp.]|uniref:hypothetical protein n=1 Tax=Anaerococcus sp. TaxID=1872515 RepID=UPI0029054DE3
YLAVFTNSILTHLFVRIFNTLLLLNIYRKCITSNLCIKKEAIFCLFFELRTVFITNRIATNYILGFNKEIEIDKHNLMLLDSLDSIQNDRFENDLVRIFPELE